MFRFHDIEQTFRNLFRPTRARFGAFRFGDPLGNIIASGVIQSVVPAEKGAIFAQNRLELAGRCDGAFLGVEFDLETHRAAFEGLRTLLHAFVDQQKMAALPSRKQRGTEGESVNFALDPDLATQPPDAGCIERYVDNDPVQAGSEALQSSFEELGGRWALGLGVFRHRRRGDSKAWAF